MFTNAKNIQITGGSFNVNASVSSLDVLYSRVAPNAILNAGGHANEVGCHPGTREEVIDHIERWADAQDGHAQTAPIFWLSGPAGAGKSAIVQTVAERCKQRGSPQANFFFFRGDTSRSQVPPLIATLLHQIILLYPSLRDPVATVLSTNPLLFDSPLEDQLEQLIVTPLRSISQLSSTHFLPVLLIDGLDECDSGTKLSQPQILRAFDQVLVRQCKACPFRLLVASRDESQIRAAFNKLTSECIHIFLNDEYSPEHDIRVFVNARFEEVRLAHPLAHTLGAIWPLVNDIDYIVEKSSGHFIYAATVMRFILDSSASPLVSLERIKGAAKLARKSPFSHLDEIYTYILSRADDQETLKDVLHAQQSINSASNTVVRILSTVYQSLVPILDLLELVNKRYTNATILSCLADITPIARYDPSARKLLFYHASFSDFLLDQSRSMEYSVAMAGFHYKIMPVVWRHLIDHGQRENWWLQFGLSGLTELQKLPPQLMSMVAMTNFEVKPKYQPMKTDIFQFIYNLCGSDNDIQHFRHLFYNWIQNCDGDLFDNIKDKPFGLRYYYMARVKYYDTSHSEMLAALHPETDFDRHESSLWLRDSVFSYHRKKWPNDTEGYKRLLKFWIPWAIENDIPCDFFEDLPYAQGYIKKNASKKWTKQLFKFKFGVNK